MNNIKEFFEKLVNWFNPLESDFNNAWDFISYGLKVIILLAFIITLVLIIKKRKNITSFLSNTLLELKKVEWLDKKSLREYSIIVILIITLTTLLILGLDQGYLSLRNILI